MNLIDLKEAVSHIKQAVDAEDKNGSPFFFIVGAGISHPSVPLAAAITAHCQEVAREYDRNHPPSKPDDPMEAYSHWFREAYPQPEDRRRYLHELIDKKPISDANLRLAHLLDLGPIGRLVVTPNFDDFLSRALQLFGTAHVGCDHPATTERIAPARPEVVQIVQVHGSHWFYDCTNLTDEMTDVAGRTGAPIPPVSMPALLDELLAHRSPLVTGYSGWSGDVIMSALRRRLLYPDGRNRRLGHNLYWFCYRREEAERLPAFLNDHANVCLVVPPPAVPERATYAERSGVINGTDRDEPSAEGGRRSLSGVQPAASGSIGRAGGVAGVSNPSPAIEAPLADVLSGQQVFESFILAFDLKAPRLFEDPLAHFAEHLARQFDVTAGSVSSDIYGIQDVLRRIRAAAELEQNQEQASQIERDMEAIRDLLRRADHREVVRRVAAIDLTQVTDGDPLRDLLTAAYEAALGLLDDSDEELLGYELVGRIGARLDAVAPETAQGVRLEIATAVLYRGLTLGSLGRGDEAVAAYDEVVRRFGEAPEAALRGQVARALVNKGFSLGELGRGDAAVAAYDEVMRRFGEAPEAALRQQVARAHFNLACFMALAGRLEDAARELGWAISARPAHYCALANSDTDLAALRACGDLWARATARCVGESPG
ncbi:MAG: SIR2 family protein [Chloroflexota bacterium]